MGVSRWRDERGLTIPIVALLISTLVLMVSFAVDLGRQRADRRLAQAGADVVALDMVRIVEGRTLDQVVNDPATATALSESATRNGFSNNVGFTVDTHLPRITNIEWGRIGPNANGSTFSVLTPAAGVDTDADGTQDLQEVPNAVRITAERTTDYFFQPGEGGVLRQAVATEDKAATFMVGSKLVSVDTSSAALLNSVLGPALGGPLNVDAVSYTGLVDAGINLGQLAAELGFGSPTEMASGTVTAQEFYLAAAQVMANNGNTAGAEVFEAAGTTVDGTTTIDMGTLFDFEQGGPDDEANASVDAFSLLTGSAEVINGESTISVPSLGVTVPGVTATSMSLDVTQPPVTVSGPVGTSANVRQVAMTLDLALAPTTVSGLLITGTVTLDLEVAGGTGTLNDIDCGRPGIGVGLAPRPVRSIVGLDLRVRANVPLLGSVAVANVTGTGADVTTQGTSNGATFDHPTEFLPTVGTGTMVASNPTTLGIAGASNVTSGNVQVLGVSGGPATGTIVAAVNTLLGPLLTQLDAMVVNQLSTQLGLNIGGADIGAVDMSCRSVKLVG
jgi:uncharacterized membrane protein